ncbi:uncharacterized protein LOC102611441 isoform X2 [Citrus sinensis]|uniref:uncharacterized protein LOC102611441 isoform X2 n=1 Tax=Citrus sinensis TaxID=2711 RepID=UPI002278DBCC|nr:uncharacterized protein LOC102611441 isoform X2 [Citrus sinensis]
MSLLLLRPKLITSSRTLSLLLPPPLKDNFIKKNVYLLSTKAFSSSITSTPYPLQYDMIINHPTQPQQSQTRRRPARVNSTNLDENQNPDGELGFDSWVDKKLEKEAKTRQPGSDNAEMTKSMRKYYNKRRKRMYGTDSEDEYGKNDDGFVELKPEVVEFNRLHKREEELYFYDTFAYPWEKDKHYKMVYQLEKKYFPDQCLDKAFLDPSADQNVKKMRKKAGGKSEEKKYNKEDDKRLVFFDDQEKKSEKDSILGEDVNVKREVSAKKVEEFFKCLKKVPNKENEVGSGEPYIVSRSTELPPTWDGPFGAMVLVNKPKGESISSYNSLGSTSVFMGKSLEIQLCKLEFILCWEEGWTSFTVCGKLRRLVKVKKVGHAGTLDPMATGLLIVCVGKATKLVDRYQGMIKGYSGVFRLGEATSTWDADSPVIQREPWEHIKDEDIRKAAASFRGEIWQVPPMFSAIKVGGEKMYDKARRGESIELSPRQISIFQFDIERSLEDRQNLIFRVTCSKGTYIRSLCADFGKALGSCAHLTALRRDSIGQYSADDAWEFKELEEAITKNYF